MLPTSYAFLNLLGFISLVIFAEESNYDAPHILEKVEKKCS
jgi:hypothetical protein